MEMFARELRNVFLGMRGCYILRTHARRDDKIKPGGTPVGNLDIYTMDELSRFISNYFPGDSIIAEEQKKSPPEIKRILEDQKRHWWSVDGTDGTGNRSMGLFSYGGMISRGRGDKVLFAGIFLPTAETIRGDGFFWAGAGRGAWMWCGDHWEYHKLHTVNPGDLPRMVVMLEGSSKKFFDPPISDLGRVVTTRSSCSSCVAAATVAMGFASALVTVENALWDNKPAQLLIQEAGGVITDWQGNPLAPDCGNMIAAANQEDLGKILEIMNR